VRGLPPDAQSLFARYTRGPTLLREALRGLTASGLNARPPGHDWSPRDITVHLADAELVTAVSVRTLLVDDGAAVALPDYVAWQRRLQYLWRSPEAALATFEQVRFGTGELLARIDAAGWARSGTRPGGDAISVRGLVEEAAMRAEDGAARVQQIRGA
jgi:hypothetical protein